MDGQTIYKKASWQEDGRVDWEPRDGQMDGRTKGDMYVRAMAGHLTATNVWGQAG